MKKLSSKVHGIIDYAVIIFLWLSPTLFALSSTTSLFTYVLGSIHLALTITTDFEMGLFRIVPLKIHGLIELFVSVALVVVAFVLGNIDGSKSMTFYLIVAAAIFATWLITDYKSMMSKTNSDI
jgi:hypothetical protein